VSDVQNAGQSRQYDLKASLRMGLLAQEDSAHALDAATELWSASDEMTPEFYRKVLKTALNILQGIPRSCDQVSIEVAKTLRYLEDQQIEVIRKILLSPSRLLVVEPSAEGKILHPSRQNAQEQRKSFAYNYIKEQGVPVHLQELFCAMQDFEPELIPDTPTRSSAIRTVSSLVERDERFAWAGPSTWGLREWGYPPGVSSIGSAAVEFLRASSQPLSTTEVTLPLSQLYRISRAAVYAALKKAEGATVRRDPTGRWYAI
jgi:hypothetical protein